MGSQWLLGSGYLRQGAEADIRGDRRRDRNPLCGTNGC